MMQMQQTKADLEAQMKKQLEELNDREQEAGNAKQITMKMNWMQELRSAISSSKKWRISSVTQQALWGESGNAGERTAHRSIFVNGILDWALTLFRGELLATTNCSQSSGIVLTSGCSNLNNVILRAEGS